MKIAAPRLPNHLEISDSWSLVPEATIEGVHISDGELTGRSLRAVSIDESKLSLVALTQSKLEKLVVRDSIFEACDLSAVSSPELSLQRSTISNARATGWDLSQGIIRDVTFDNCKLNLANFRFARLANVRFRACILNGADFLQAHLTNVHFEACELEQTDFNHAILKAVDLRSSQLQGIRGWQYLKGVTISNAQLITAAPYLAAEIGITVAD